MNLLKMYKQLSDEEKKELVSLFIEEINVIQKENLEGVKCTNFVVNSAGNVTCQKKNIKGSNFNYICSNNIYDYAIRAASEAKNHSNKVR